MELYIFLPSLLLLLAMFLVSAFFSCSESALTAASRARMHMLAQEGDWRAATVNRILDNKDRLIGAILFGNNTANTLAAALSTSVLIKIFGDAGVYYATVAMTVLLLVFSEVLPKTYALYHADSVARIVAPAVNVLVIVTTPITHVVSLFVRWLLGLFGVQIGGAGHGSDVEELRGAIELHQGPEEEVKDRRNMLRSVLDLADITVGEVMTHRRNVDMVSLDQNVEDAIEAILELNHSRVPLWSVEPDNIVGVVHVKQLLFALHDVRGDTSQINLASLMSKPWFIPDTTSLLDQMQAFQARREHFALVIDEYGTFMGAVTLEDILEEIVGEIDDEQDLVVPGVRRMPDGSYLVNGDLPIRDLNRELGWDLPDDNDYTTAAGLVIYESRTLPIVGQSFLFYGFQFDVMKRQRNQITVLRILPQVDEKTPA